MTNSQQYGGTTVPAVAIKQFIQPVNKKVTLYKEEISKAVTVRATKAYTDNRGIATLIHSFEARRDCVIFKPRHVPVALTPRESALGTQ
jgi:hypothetical protein